MIRSWASVALFVIFASPCRSQDLNKLPIRRVILYKNGVGYFEHSGIVHGNGTTELRFKTSEINDIRSPPRAYASIWRSGRRMIHHATIQRGATHHEHGLENA